MDIGHPGHVHLLRNAYFELLRKGHSIVVTVKDIDSAKDLLNIYGIPFISLGSKKDSIFLKGFNQVLYNMKMFMLIRKRKIDVAIGSTVTIAHISKISKMRSIILDDDDDEVEPLFVKYAHPFADVILSPDVLRKKRKSKKALFYSGYHELAYLHPDLFKPDEAVLSELNLDKNDSYFVLRFNVFKAHHDIGVRGLSLENKIDLVNYLSKLGKVFITAEREIEPELEKYKLTVSPEKIHSLIYYSKMFLGDSQTMSSEAAVLGVPSIRCNTLVGKISYLEEQERKYGLTFGFKPSDFDLMMNKIEELIMDKDLKTNWKSKQRAMLKDKINVSNYLVEFIEDYGSVSN